ncbi:MAG: hypothetical protein FWF53_05645 [Candidatus Azobacteroides sp.]|nr:hypothetical protein [Candidatus Azobacteroides sp.]
MENNIIEIETTCDLRLNIRRAGCTITDEKGERRAPDEIALLIYGYDTQSGDVTHEFVTLSPEDAENLSMELWNMSNQIKHQYGIKNNKNK